MNKDRNDACFDFLYYFTHFLDDNILSVDYSRNFLVPAMRLSCYEEEVAPLCCRLSHTWVTWQKSSSHSVCPWGKVSSQGCHLVLDSSV